MMSGFAASIFMLVGGVFALQKRHFVLAFVGPFLIMSWYLSIVLSYGVSAFPIFMVLVPIIVVTLLVMSRKEFS